MKPSAFILICVMMGLHSSAAQESPPEDQKLTHEQGASNVADKQDELAADVQQLTIEQTVPQVIQLLNQVEKLMDESTDKLAGHDTSGNTIAVQTEIIEKIHEAAKARQQKDCKCQGSGAMMKMLENMMGKAQGGEQPGKKPGNEGPGETGGNGQTGDSNAPNETVTGHTGGKSEARRIPKNTSSKSTMLPEEFKKALDAYNQGAEKKVK